MLNDLSNVAKNLFSGTIEVSHEDIKQRFGIHDQYEQDPFLPTSLLYKAITINYSATREQIDNLSGAQCLYDEWYKDMFPEKYKINYPNIEKRSGVLYQGQKKQNPFQKTKTPHIVYNYYQSGKTPKLGILVTDSDSEPTARFAMVANLSLDAPDHSMLAIKSLRVDDKIVLINDENVAKALAYGEALFQQIKLGQTYSPDMAQKQSVKIQSLRI